MKLAEQIVVETDEFHLSESGEQLALLNRVERMLYLQLATAAGNGSRGYQYHLMSLPFEPGYLVDQGRHAGNIQFSVGTGQHVGTYLYYYSSFHKPFVMGALRHA